MIIPPGNYGITAPSTDLMTIYVRPHETPAERKGSSLDFIQFFQIGASIPAVDPELYEVKT
jgi:hypothetical protein